MKVLHIINGLGAGGAEKLIDELVPIMNSYDNVEAEVLLLDDKNNIFNQKLKENNVKVKTIPYKNIYSLKNVFYIKNYIKKKGYDIVHSHLFPSNYFTAISSWLIFKNKPKFITTEHNTHNRRRNKRYLRFLEKIIYSSYDSIVSISKGTQDNLMNWIKPKEKDKSKFKIINNGINLSDFKDAKPYKKSKINPKFSEETKLICMVGSFSKQKDQATIIRAIKLLAEDVNLILVGDGPLRKELENLAKEIGVSSRVEFLGIRNDVPRIFKTSDIIIVSSHWEGFGLVAAEGMATGKPVIASDVAGLKEVVEGAGILFDKGNSQELSGIIKDMLSNSIKYNETLLKCAKRAEEFDIENMIKQYIKEYEGLLKIKVGTSNE